MKNGDNPNYSIVEKSLGDLRKLAITPTPSNVDEKMQIIIIIIIIIMEQ